MSVVEGDLKMKKIVVLFGIALLISINVFAKNSLNCKVSADLIKDSVIEQIYQEISIEKGFLHPVYAEKIYLKNFDKMTDSYLMIGAGGNGNGITDSEVVRIKLFKGADELFSGAVFSNNGTFRSVSNTKINDSAVLISIECK